MGSLNVGCAFCEIVSGDRSAQVVYRDEGTVAFLDRRPLFAGHTLVVPSRHIETLGDLPDDEMAAVMRVVRGLSRAMESGLGSGGSFVAINNRVSQSVPHVHVHVVPRSKGDGLKGFFWPRTGYAGDQDAERVAGLVRAALESELGLADRS